MARKAFVAGVALFVVLLGYSLHQPVPADYSRPWSLYATAISTKLGFSLVHTLHEFGIKDVSDLMDAIYDWTHPVDHPDKYPDILVNDVLFDNLTVRLYRRKQQEPDTGKRLLPGLMYYHGGGFVLGNPHSYDEVLIQILRATNLVIASVHYRLAPKYPFPVPVEDCVRATRYFMTRAADYGVDADRIGVAGDSAGGNLAAVVSLRLRDEQFDVQPKVQVMIYPSVQRIDLETPSYQEHGDGPIVTRGIAAWFSSLYIAGDSRYVASIANNSHTPSTIKKSLAQSVLNHDLLPQKFLQHPYRRPSLEHGDEDVWNSIRDTITRQDYSPLLAPSHSGLPAAFVFTAGADVLRDDGFFYVHKLRQDGVEVEHVHIPSGFHGMFNMAVGHKEHRELMDKLINYLNAKL